MGDNDRSVITPGSWRAWWLAARPATLPLACAPVLVASAICIKAGSFSIAIGSASLAGAILLQLLANIANDLFDHLKGTDNEERLGPPRAAQLGLLSIAQLRRAIVLLIVVLFAIGSYLAWQGGVVIIGIGLTAIASAILYTAGPWPLAYVGLGDVFVWIFFGFAATCGAVYVQLGHVPPQAWICGAIMGSLANAVLVVNHVRDENNDRNSGKKTLVVRFGRRFGLIQYALLLIVPFVAPWFLFAYAVNKTSLIVLLALLAVPLRLWRDLKSKSGPELNKVLAQTARFAVLYAVLLSVVLAR